jgi:hypothetical protein
MHGQTVEEVSELDWEPLDYGYAAEDGSERVSILGKRRGSLEFDQEPDSESVSFRGIGKRMRQ